MRALLASSIIALISLIEGAPADLYLLRKFIISFAGLCVAYYIIKRIEERKK